MQKLKDLIHINKLLILLAINIAIYTALCFLCAFVYPKERDIFVNLATSILTMGIAVFFVDSVIKANQKRPWQNAEKVAKEDIITIANNLVSSVVTPMSFPFLTEYLGKIREFIGSDTYLKDVTGWDLQKVEEIGVETLLKQMSDDSWKGLYQGIQKIQTEVGNCIALYGNILLPEVQGSLLSFNKDFKDDYSIFGNLLLLLIQQLESGELDKKEKEAFIGNFAKDLENYFKKVKEFRQQLEDLAWY